MMRKKVLLVMCFILVLNYFSFAQETEKKSFIVGGHVATAFSDYGVLNGVIIGGTGEYYFLPYLSGVTNIDFWIIADFMYSTSLGINVHPLGPGNFDPYLGGALWMGQIFSQELYVIDVPAVAGVNVRVSDTIGIQLQGRLYLLSLPLILIEADLGIFYQF
jgi:hypothetical protein